MLERKEQSLDLRETVTLEQSMLEEAAMLEK